MTFILKLKVCTFWPNWESSNHLPWILDGQCRHGGSTEVRNAQRRDELHQVGLPGAGSLRLRVQHYPGKEGKEWVTQVREGAWKCTVAWDMCPVPPSWAQKGTGAMDVGTCFWGMASPPPVASHDLFCQPLVIFRSLTMKGQPWGKRSEQRKWLRFWAEASERSRAASAEMPSSICTPASKSFLPARKLVCVGAQ